MAPHGGMSPCALVLLVQVPDVAKQLLMRCMASPDCQPLLLEEQQGMAQDLHNTRSRLEAAECELASSIKEVGGSVHCCSGCVDTGCHKTPLVHRCYDLSG